jgi:hypothetical protein
VECKNGISDIGLKGQLLAGKKRMSDRIYRKTVQLDIKREIVRSVVRLREINYSMIWKIIPPLKRKKT